MENNSFPKKIRLRYQAEYKFVFKKPNRFSDQYFIFFSRVNGLGNARLGLAISKKKIRTAVARNRIKRLVRESFRLNYRTLLHLDIVVLAGSGAQSASNQSLKNSLKTYFEHHRKI